MVLRRLSLKITMDDLELQETALLRLVEKFGTRLQRNVPLVRHTAARLGGPAAALIEVRTIADLVEAVTISWEGSVPFRIFGGGSNVLVSDMGYSGLVIINRTSQIRFEETALQPSVWAESGVNFGLIARLAAQRGLAGLEWAASIPGTFGGALAGNAGAFGSDLASNFLLAEILHHDNLEVGGEICREEWPVEKMDYAYRSSIIKMNPGKIIVLSGSLKLEHGIPESVQARLDANIASRKRTQPPGASLGSMFKNPPGDYAGRLIEAAGLKGYSVGGAQISPVHANFFINRGDASAQDYYRLIQIAKDTVAEKFDIQLELEVELLGEW